MQMIRMAVIGRGWITEKWIGAAQKIPGVAVTAAYSRSLADARAFAQAHGAALWFDSLDALCASREVDGVYVASPIALHARQTIALLEAGKHVLVEKPMTVSRANAEKMFQAAQAHGVVLMEGLRSVHTPYMAAIRNSLPKLGVLRKARLSYCQYSSKFDAYKAGQLPNTFNPALGNGALMDLGVYLVAGMIHLFGMPRALTGHSGFLGTWEANGALLADYGAMQAELSYSKISQSALPSEIQGEKGALVIDHFADGGRLYIRYRGGETEELEGCAPGISLDAETRDFFDMVKGKAQPADWQALSLNTAQVMEEARAALGIHFPPEVFAV